MENNNLGLLLASFVMIILGASFIGVVASTEQLVTTQKSVFNESIDISAARLALNDIDSDYAFTVKQAYSRDTNWREASGGTDCDITVVSYITNITLTEDTDYTLSTNGTLKVLNTTLTGGNHAPRSNTTQIAYYYCGDDYLTEGWTRTILNLVPGFFALALMAVGIALFYGVLKNEKLLGI
jgi:hypothetical protein